AAKRLWDKVEGEKGGFYPIGDLSNGQYGALGAWALTDFGIELPDAYWKVQDRFWRQLQWADGSWPYLSWGSHESKEAMGTAGIASLYVCQEFVDNELRLIPKPDPHIEKGLKWLEATYKPTSADYYYQYGVERIGLASGLKFFGTTNWYKEAATAMVRTQRKDGSWTSNLAPHITTPYVLLFLARGRNPVVFNKLQYNGHWNARPRDDANVTRWLSKRYEKPINWQVVNLQVSPEEWMDAPILLITGSADPKFTPADLAKLRTFIQAGGMIFSTADGNSPTFSTAIKKYANEVMDKKYEMRNLPKDHLLFSKELGVEIPNPPAMLGMSNGAREVWIHSTTDLGADWQMRRYANKSSFELGAALYFYASGRASLRSKLQPLTVDAGNVTPARTITVAQIDYPGNTEPEPGAWPRMAKLAKANFKTDLKLATLKPTELDPKKTPLAHMTGTTRIVFTQDDANALRTYLDAGGLLFVDSAAGSENFTASCKELFQKIYPDTELTALPPDHPIYTGSMPDGVKIDDIQFRTYGELRLQRKVRSPALEMLAINGKPRVIFSSWDVCSGFLGTNTWSIVGYAASTSEKLGRNIVLYATPNPQQQ
ncbi:MAG: DUF4159 domain-containing protein, partial [Phycisphaerales bacterium]|nr:DUF4159 domain-containing protein [Phycisphaerales bacterium]